MGLTQCTCHLFLVLCLLIESCRTLPSGQTADDNSLIIDLSYGTGASSTGQRTELHARQSDTKFRGAPQQSARIFFNVLGDIVSSVPFLPLEINIPDTISQTIAYIGWWFSGNSQDEGGQEEELQRVLIDGIFFLFLKENSK